MSDQFRMSPSASRSVRSTANRIPLLPTVMINLVFSPTGLRQPSRKLPRLGNLISCCHHFCHISYTHKKNLSRLRLLIYFVLDSTAVSEAPQHLSFESDVDLATSLIHTPVEFSSNLKKVSLKLFLFCCCVFFSFTLTLVYCQSQE